MGGGTPRPTTLIVTALPAKAIWLDGCVWIVGAAAIGVACTLSRAGALATAPALSLSDGEVAVIVARLTAGADPSLGPPTPSERDVPVPALAPHEVGPVLGDGGMGVVYRAVDVALKRSFPLPPSSTVVRSVRPFSPSVSWMASSSSSAASRSAAP